MRLSIVVATTVALLLVFDDNVLVPVGAARRQKRLQLLKPQQHKHTSTYGRSSDNSNIEAHARSADTLDAPVAAASDSEQMSGDSGRGFMAKWMMLKSMLQPSQPPPSNNIIILTEPTYTTLTTPTTTTITSPTYTYITPTTSTATNSTRGQFTRIVYARQDNGGAHEDGVRVDSPDANPPLAPTMTNAPKLTATNAGIPLFMGTKPAMTNQIPMIGQFPRPAPQIWRNNNRGQLNQNVRRRRIQTQRNGVRNKPVNNYNKRRRLPVVQGAGGKPLQQRPKRRKVVQIPNQIRKVNRKGNSGDSVVIVNKVDQVGVGGGNKFDTNSRLQHFMNHLRHPQLPIVHNHH